MKIKKSILACFLLCAAILAAGYYLMSRAPISQRSVNVDKFGAISIAQPLWGAQAIALVFVDANKFSSVDLAQRLAKVGVFSIVVDTLQFYKHFNTQNHECLGAKQLVTSINILKRELSLANDKQMFVTGIGDGALIPFLNAQSETGVDAINLSLGFSVYLPAKLNICPPLKTEHKELKHYLLTGSDIRTNWRSVWVDQPPEETAVFIKEKVAHADNYIAAYNTPLDTQLINELSASIGQKKDTPPMPVVEIPAAKSGDTITLFYSGDGGWRDLDRTVAEQMAAWNYPVVGVDVLRYFWERKTPEQVAADLVATMRYYRKKWGVKSFVLAGFSFGADILPLIYNRLPETDKDNVDLLVFLALGNHADFEVRVGGWLGQTTHEIPLAPDLAKIPKQKILCIYGKKEKASTGTACTGLAGSGATIIELPGGHHFDNDYPKLTRLILDNYQQHGIY